MRKQILLIIILCLSAMMVRAERIDVSTARKVAENVANAGSGLRSAEGLTLVYAAAPGQSGSTLRSGTVSGDADYYVFNVGSENGFVIVAGDDRVRPVLGYADEGSFDAGKLPPNAAAWLAGYQEEISGAISKDIQPSVAIRQEWNEYLNGRLRLRAASVSLKTPSWGQNAPYNQSCPDTWQGMAVTGCVATAMAIVMKYHGAPTEASPTNRRTDFNGKTITYAPYRWNDMLDTYSGVTYTDAQHEIHSFRKFRFYGRCGERDDRCLQLSHDTDRLSRKPYGERMGRTPTCGTGCQPSGPLRGRENDQGTRVRVRWL